MKERFEGKDGWRRLVEVFSEQELVQHNTAIAHKLADLANLEEYPKKKQLYVKGEPGKNVLFFVLCGSFDLLSQDNLKLIEKEGEIKELAA